MAIPKYVYDFLNEIYEEQYGAFLGYAVAGPNSGYSGLYYDCIQQNRKRLD